MGADQDFDVDAEIVRTPQDLDNASHRPLVRAAEVHNLRCDDHAVQILDGFHIQRASAHPMHGFALGWQGHLTESLAVGNLDPLPDAVVVRDHEVAVAANAELAHHRRVRALEHAQNLAMRAAIRFDAADPSHHAIAVHGPRGVFLGNVNVALEAAFDAGDGDIRRDEGEAVAMNAEASGGEFAAGAGRDILPRSRFYDRSACRQPVKLGFDVRLGHSLPRQLAQQLFERGAPVRQLADVVEDQARL